jgi:hypothetical protein
MLWYALAEIVVIVPLAAIYFRAPPEVIHPAASGANSSKARVLGWPPNAVFAVMCGAALLCCLPMAMPPGHLVAFCSDLGISRSMGALMLSVLLGTAFLSRQIWPARADWQTSPPARRQTACESSSGMAIPWVSARQS